MPDDQCRLSKVESEVEAHKTVLTGQSKDLNNQYEYIREFKEEIKEELQGIKDTLLAIQLDRSKQAGFIAGGVFVIGALFTVAGLIFKKFLG